MSFFTLISTTSAGDLAQFNGRGVTFWPYEHNPPERRYLTFPHVWLVADAYGESNGLRNVGLPNIQRPWFGPPEDWCPEHADNVDATHHVYAVLSRLVDEGAEVDSFTFWDQSPDRVRELQDVVEVSLSEIGAPAFRFLDGYRFVYRH